MCTEVKLKKGVGIGLSTRESVWASGTTHCGDAAESTRDAVGGEAATATSVRPPHLGADSVSSDRGRPLPGVHRTPAQRETSVALLGRSREGGELSPHPLILKSPSALNSTCAKVARFVGCVPVHFGPTLDREPLLKLTIKQTVLL